MNTPAITKDTTIAFWRDIARIQEVVRPQVKDKDADLLTIQITTWSKLAAAKDDSRQMIERMLRFTRRLLELPLAPTAGAVAASDKQTDEFLKGCCQVLNVEKAAAVQPGMPAPPEIGLDAFIERSDEVLMESLTAAWLALYFLGEPFIHPWEKVRRIADYRDGFPSGGCIAKYVGDVYRAARHDMMRQAAPLKSEPMLVLSYVPYVLLDGLLDGGTGDDLTPASVHGLARLYGMMQMRLYFDPGYPVDMFVPIGALKDAVAHLGGKGGAPLEGVKPWLDTLFRHPNPGQSVTLLLNAPETAGMPTCVLGPKSGIYTLETGNSALHFSGNQVRGALLKSYRDKLKRLGKSGDSKNLLILPMSASALAWWLSRKLNPV
jgi:hypothetical protein